MQPINFSLCSNSNYVQNNNSNNVSFQAGTLPIESKLSIKAQGLIRRANHFLEDTWTAIRKGKVNMSEPIYIDALKNHDVVVLKPVYNGRNSMLIEISNDKYIENIMIDRVRQSDFTYEKRVITDYGSATLRSYNSKKDNNRLLEDEINTKIEESLTKILPELSIRKMLKR